VAEAERAGACLDVVAASLLCLESSRGRPRGPRPCGAIRSLDHSLLGRRSGCWLAELLAPSSGCFWPRPRNSDLESRLWRPKALTVRWRSPIPRPSLSAFEIDRPPFRAHSWPLALTLCSTYSRGLCVTPTLESIPSSAASAEHESRPVPAPTIPPASSFLGEHALLDRETAEFAAVTAAYTRSVQQHPVISSPRGPFLAASLSFSSISSIRFSARARTRRPCSCGCSPSSPRPLPQASGSRFRPTRRLIISGTPPFSERRRAHRRPRRVRVAEHTSRRNLHPRRWRSRVVTLSAPQPPRPVELSARSNRLRMLR